MEDEKILKRQTTRQRLVQQQSDIVDNLIHNMSNVTNEQIVDAHQVSHKVSSITVGAKAAASGANDNIAVKHQLKDAAMMLQQSLHGQYSLQLYYLLNHS